jgi:hypothetical protein
MSETTSHAASPSTVPFRNVAVGLLHVLALTAIAVAQPLFDLLGRNAEFFVARGSQPIDIWLMTVGLVFGIPVLAFGVESIAWLVDRRAYRITHLLFIGLLSGLIALQVFTRLVPFSGWLLVVASVLGAVAVALAYDRFEILRSFLSWLAIAPIAVTVLFLLFSPVNRVAFPSNTAAEAGEFSAADTPVVIVVWDAFNSVGLAGPDGEIDVGMYPNFARLANDGTWYRRASGVSDSTSMAVPAITDGRFPSSEELPIFADHPRNLFTLLGESHTVVAREPVTAVCPPSICEDTTPQLLRKGLGGRLKSLAFDLRIVYLHVLLPEDLKGSLPAIDRVWSDFGANAAPFEGTAAPSAITSTDEEELRKEFADRRGNDRTRHELATDRATSVKEFIDALPQESVVPPFVFLHAALPHAPYRYAPSGRQYSSSGELFGLENGEWTGSEWAITQAQQRYLMQIGVADDLLGDIFDWLVSQGMYDDALVIVTADHGVGFTANGLVRTSTTENFGETMSVPMIVKLPGDSSGVTSDADVRTIDILPTVIDVLGAQVEWEVDGRSMLAETIDRGPKAEMRTNGVVVGSDATMPAWDVALSDKVRRFADESESIDVYRPGNSPLVGVTIPELPISGVSAGAIQVDGLEQIVNIDIGSPIAPNHLTGRIHLDEPSATELEVVVAINGVVRVVGPIVAADTLGGRFSYFVPEDSFRDGQNTVAFFVIDEALGMQKLLPLALDSGRLYSTSVYADGNEYLESDGVGIPINSRLSGGIEAVVSSGGIYTVAGWAADTELTRPADEIVVVVDGVSVLVLSPNKRRADVADSLGGDIYELSGFGLELPADLIDGADSVRLFAVSVGEAATEMSFPSSPFGVNP